MEGLRVNWVLLTCCKFAIVFDNEQMIFHIHTSTFVENIKNLKLTSLGGVSSKSTMVNLF